MGEGTECEGWVLVGGLGAIVVVECWVGVSWVGFCMVCEDGVGESRKAVIKGQSVAQKT